MIQKIKITMAEFKEVKVFNPLKFWKGRHIEDNLLRKTLSNLSSMIAKSLMVLSLDCTLAKSTMFVITLNGQHIS